jgi:hypothetical protein
MRAKYCAAADLPVDDGAHLVMPASEAFGATLEFVEWSTRRRDDVETDATQSR